MRQGPKGVGRQIGVSSESLIFHISIRFPDLTFADTASMFSADTLPLFGA